MEIKKYLLRIGLSPDMPIPHTCGSLKMLQEAHIYSVPYENLDVIDGVPVSLQREDIYAKVVDRHRGGFCFELNSLFEWLLSELGFKTESYFSRFWRGEVGIPLRRHRVIAVFLDGETYILDVGIGAVAPRVPLLLKAGLVQECFGESYRFEFEDKFGWVLYELHHGEWKRYFSFTTEPTVENDYTAISYYCEKHPDSKFNKSFMVAMKNREGRKSVDGNIYKEFKGRELVKIEENMTADRTNEIFEKEFGLKR